MPRQDVLQRCVSEIKEALSICNNGGSSTSDYDGGTTSFSLLTKKEFKEAKNTLQKILKKEIKGGTAEKENGKEIKFPSQRVKVEVKLYSADGDPFLADVELKLEANFPVDPAKVTKAKIYSLEMDAEMRERHHHSFITDMIEFANQASKSGSSSKLLHMIESIEDYAAEYVASNGCWKLFHCDPRPLYIVNESSIPIVPIENMAFKLASTNTNFAKMAPGRKKSISSHSRSNNPKSYSRSSSKNKKSRKMFADHVEDLRLYVLQNGNANIPQTYPANQNLATWVGNIRYSCRLIERGSVPLIKLTKERLELLVGVGFEVPQGVLKQAGITNVEQIKAEAKVEANAVVENIEKPDSLVDKTNQQDTSSGDDQDQEVEVQVNRKRKLSLESMMNQNDLTVKVSYKFECTVAAGPLGIILRNSPEGVQVVNIDPDSQCKSKLEIGDIIETINSKSQKNSTAKDAKFLLSQSIDSDRSLVMRRVSSKKFKMTESEDQVDNKVSAKAMDTSSNESNTEDVEMGTATPEMSSSESETENEAQVSDLKKKSPVTSATPNKKGESNPKPQAIRTPEDNTHCFEFVTSPGPLGLNLCPNPSLGFKILDIFETSQCKGKLEKYDYVESIDGHSLKTANVSELMTYLSDCKEKCKILGVKRERSSSPVSTTSEILDGTEKEGKKKQ